MTEGTLEPKVFGPRISTLFEPIGVNQPQPFVLWVGSNRGHKTGMVNHCSSNQFNALTLLLAENKVHRPATARVRSWSAAMRQEVVAPTARFFQGVRKDR